MKLKHSLKSSLFTISLLISSVEGMEPQSDPSSKCDALILDSFKDIDQAFKEYCATHDLSKQSKLQKKIVDEIDFLIATKALKPENFDRTHEIIRYLYEKRLNSSYSLNERDRWQVIKGLQGSLKNYIYQHHSTSSNSSLLNWAMGDVVSTAIGYNRGGGKLVKAQSSWLFVLPRELFDQIMLFYRQGFKKDLQAENPRSFFPLILTNKFWKDYIAALPLEVDFSSGHSNHPTQSYLHKVVSLFPSIRSLSLLKCSYIHEDGLGYITKLTNLLSLSVYDNFLTKDLFKLTNLTSLKLYSSGYAPQKPSSPPIEMDGLLLSHIPYLTNLRCLEFRGIDSLTDKELSQFSNLTNLTQLHLCETDVDGPGLGELGGLTGLRSLRCAHRDPEGVTPLSYITVFSNLTNLKFCGEYGLDDFNSETLYSLSSLVNLTKLDLSFSGVNGEKFQNLDFSNLRELHLGNTNINDGGLHRLSKYTTLEVLSLWNLDGFAGGIITNNGLLALTKLTALREFNLVDVNGYEISDEGLKHLSLLTNMQILKFVSSGITDIGMPYLVNLTNLIELNLEDANITEKAFPYLSSLQKLRKLTLPPITLTENGSSYLTNLTDLRKLYLHYPDALKVGNYLSALTKLENRYALTQNNRF